MNEYRDSAARTTVSRSTWQRLNDRKLIHWAIGYAAGAWVLLQVLSFLGGAFDWPASVLKALGYLFASGIFPVLVIAWFHGDQGEQQVSGTEVMVLGAYLVFVVVFGLQNMNRTEDIATLYDLESFDLDVISIDPPIDTILTAEYFDPVLEVAVDVEYAFDPPLSELPLVDDLTLDLGVIYDESEKSVSMMQHDSKSVGVHPHQTTLRGRIDRSLIRTDTLKLQISANMHKRDNSTRMIGAPVRIEYDMGEAAGQPNN